MEKLLTKIVLFLQKKFAIFFCIFCFSFAREKCENFGKFCFNVSRINTKFSWNRKWEKYFKGWGNVFLYTGYFILLTPMYTACTLCKILYLSTRTTSVQLNIRAGPTLWSLLGLKNYNVKKVISKVDAFFVLQCTVFRMLCKHKTDVTAWHGIHKKSMKYS